MLRPLALRPFLCAQLPYNKYIHIWFQRLRYDLSLFEFRGMNRHFEISNTEFPYQLVDIENRAPFEAVCISSLLKVKTQRSYRVYGGFTQAIPTGLRWLQHGFVFTHMFFDHTEHGANVNRWRTLAAASGQVEGGTVTSSNNKSRSPSKTTPSKSLQPLYSVKQHF